MRIQSRHAARVLGLTLLFLGSSCVSTDDIETPDSPEAQVEREPEPPAPWTEHFRQSTLAMADRVFIEGPKGLLDHLATRSEDGFHSYEAETLPAGFQQTFKVIRPEAGVELRAYLDGYEIVAFQELVVIERPGELDVRVHLSGDAFLRESDSGVERRGPQLEIVGKIERPATDAR